MKLKQTIAGFLKPLSSNKRTVKFFAHLYRFSIFGLLGDEWDFYRNGEIKLLELLNKKFDKSIIVFDVGANEGTYSEAVVNALGDSRNLTLHGFEPASDTFARYYSRFKNVQNVICNQLGLSDKSQTLPLYKSNISSGFASVYNEAKFDLNSSESISLTTIDDYCLLNAIERIDFLKMDVEGHELAVLKGAKRMIENNAIQVIQFEFGAGNMGSRTYFKDFYGLLNGRYSLYRILKNGLHPVHTYEYYYEAFGRITNYVAISRTLN